MKVSASRQKRTRSIHRHEYLTSVWPTIESIFNSFHLPALKKKPHVEDRIFAAKGRVMARRDQRQLRGGVYPDSKPRRNALALWFALMVLLSTPAPASAQADQWLRILEHLAPRTPDQIPSPGGTIYAFPALGAPPEDRSFRMRANQFVISFNDLGASEARRRIASCFGGAASVIDQIPSRAIFLLRVNGGAARVLTAYRSSCFGDPTGDGALVIEPDRIVQLFSNQHGLGFHAPLPWYFRNNGGPVAKVDADTDAAEALSRLLNERREPQEALRATVVAVIDSGMDVTHPALAPALWLNPGEIAGNGIDDDGNGYRDDINGWNVVDNNNNLADPIGHGTHVAGIIAARPAAGALSRGVAPGAAVMPVRIAFADQSATDFIVAKAIYYAMSHRPDVINMSFGGPSPSAVWNRAFLEATQAGILLVAAAGNSGQDVDGSPVYPCMSVAVICVIATDRMDQRASFSNWSSTQGFVAAPGVDVLSTQPGGRYGPLSGSSMAAPLVAGTLAAIKSLWPDIAPPAALARLFSALDKAVPSANGGATEGRLNIYRALYGPSRSYGSADGYCDETIELPASGGRILRSQNYPYANSGERGVDGMSLATPHTICTARQLLSIQEDDLDRIFVLRAHIDFALPTHTDREQIGVYVHPSGTVTKPFNGFLDGGGFEIRNYSSGGRQSAGLIADLGPHAFVTNLRFTRASINSARSGGAVAAVSRGRLFNVQVEGSVTGVFKVGGIVGEMRGGSIGSSFFEGTVSGTGTVGGLVGALEGSDTRIHNSFFQGRIKGSSAGGIVGDLHQGSVEASHAFVETDPSAASRSIGGLAGVLRCRGRIVESYAEGRISSDQEAGGLVGRIMDADLANSYASVQVSAAAQAGGAVGIRHDGLRVQIDPGAPVLYYCTGTTTRPPPSTVLRTFFDSSLAGGAGAGGEPRTSAQLRHPSTFTGWRQELWLFQPNFSPALRSLPRTQFSKY